MSESNMESLRIISGLSEIAAQYDALICDVWGVLHNGYRSEPHAVAALHRRERGTELHRLHLHRETGLGQ